MTRAGSTQGDVFFAYVLGQRAPVDRCAPAYRPGHRPRRHRAIVHEADGFAWPHRRDRAAPWCVGPAPARAGPIAAGWYGSPARSDLAVIGVTGTNGKTSCIRPVAGARAAGGRYALCHHRHPWHRFF
ncbi:hypothetical protein ACU4GD_35360 [Cupriavidus basilensis]